MKIIRYEEIDSTQLEAKRLAKKNNVSNGTVIIAKNQTKGIGTHGRKWISKKDESVTFTIILKPDYNVEELENITIKIAKCITETFKELYNINLDIKKPNDIVYNGKKIGGILTESIIQKNFVKYIFIGIGINTNQTEFTEEIQNIATSIKKEFDIDVNNERVIKNLSQKLLHFYKKDNKI